MLSCKVVTRGTCAVFPGYKRPRGELAGRRMDPDSTVWLEINLSALPLCLGSGPGPQVD